VRDGIALDSPAPDPAATFESAPVKPSSVRQIVSESLRGGSPRPADHGPRNMQEQAALGAAVAILGACLEDEAVGPLPELTAGLVQILLTPASAL
jgi:hypothetical protein